MAHLNPNSIFQSWILSPQEQDQGSVFSNLQRQVIQNHIAQYAHERTLLKYDPNNPLVFMQRDAELQGTIVTLQYLLTLSDEVSTRLNLGNQQIHLNVPSGE